MIFLLTAEQPRRPQALDWIATAVTVSLFIADRFLERGENAVLHTVGGMLALTALLFVFPPFYLLRKYGHVEQGKSYMHTTVIVDRGVYAIVRHPQYLGYMLLVLGFVLISQHGLIVLLGAIAIGFFYGHSRREEQFCVAQLGTAYERYCQIVPRFNFIVGLIRLLRS